jgi:hypothetical protein
VDPSYLSIVDGLKFRGQATFLESRENAMIPPVLRPLARE